MTTLTAFLQGADSDSDICPFDENDIDNDESCREWHKGREWEAAREADEVGAYNAYYSN